VDDRQIPNAGKSSAAYGLSALAFGMSLTQWIDELAPRELEIRIAPGAHPHSRLLEIKQAGDKAPAY